MIARRMLVALITLGATGGLLALLWQVLAPGGWAVAKLAMLVGLLGTAPWTGLCLANGLPGFLRLVSTRALAPPATVSDPPPLAVAMSPLAVAITVRSEDLAPVLMRLLHMLDALASVSPGWMVVAWVLSDTTDPQAAAAEERALAAMDDSDRARIRYRRRSDNTGFKAGNIMEFLDHHATGFDLMLVLDSDSMMSAAAVLRRR